MSDKNIIISIAIILSIIFWIPVSAQDYSGYDLAKGYYKDHNYVLSYKYLIIFKFTNIERLNKPENASTLKKLNKEIEDLEQMLSQNIDWYHIKTSRGWSDQALKDSLNNAFTKYKLIEIKIQ